MINENEYTDANGVRYEAVTRIKECNADQGCAFDDDGVGCMGSPNCWSHGSDNRSIIWIKAA